MPKTLRKFVVGIFVVGFLSLSCYGPVGIIFGHAEIDAANTQSVEQTREAEYAPLYTMSALETQAAGLDLTRTALANPQQAAAAQNTPQAGQASGTQSCRWQLTKVDPAINDGDGMQGMWAGSGPGTINTAFTHAGNMGCADQIFKTAHIWSVPPEVLIPGSKQTVTVTASWYLDNDPLCSSLTAGVSTYLNTGSTVIKAGKSTIYVSAEQSGQVTETGEWTVFKGSAPGATMSLIAHGSSGSLGGSVYYNYTYVCD